MTTPSTTTKNTPKPVDTKSEAKNRIPEPEVKSESEPATAKSRIPEDLAKETILGTFCERYLSILDKIAGYNKDVLAEKDSEWPTPKLLGKARELANPQDANVKPNAELKKLVDAWDKALTALSQARTAVLETTAKEIGITLTSGADRDPEKEAALKEERKIALEIGKQLEGIAGLTTDKNATTSVQEFLKANPVPAIGRDQVHTFGNEGSATTPKYRVKVEVIKDGNVLLSEDGFTKTALALSKPVFNYDRGASPKADTLRNAWEKAGNSATNVVSPVEFDDNGLHYVITKK